MTMVVVIPKIPITIPIQEQTFPAVATLYAPSACTYFLYLSDEPWLKMTPRMPNGNDGIP